MRHSKTPPLQCHGRGQILKALRQPGLFHQPTELVMLNIIHSSREISIPATGLQSAISLPTEVSNLETRSFPQLKIVSCTLCPTRSCLRCSKFLRSGEAVRNFEAPEVGNLCMIDIDTSKFHSGVIIPTKETVEVLREQRRIFDNKAYQREEHANACHALRI